MNLPKARMLFAAAALVCATGCAIEIQHDLTEQDANDIYSLLNEHGISATKVRDESGKEPTYVVSVPKQDASQAIKLLRDYSLPRPKYGGFSTFSKNKGMIPTATEERAMMLEAHGGEVDSALLKIHGVLDSHTIVTLPEVNDLTQPDKRPLPAASVVLVYRPPPNNEPPLSKDEIAAFIAAAVPEMTKDRVNVILKPSIPVISDMPPESRIVKVLGIPLVQAGVKDFKLLILGMGVAMLIMATVTVWTFMRGGGQVAAARTRSRQG